MSTLTLFKNLGPAMKELRTEKVIKIYEEVKERDHANWLTARAKKSRKTMIENIIKKAKQENGKSKN